MNGNGESFTPETEGHMQNMFKFGDRFLTGYLAHKHEQRSLTLSKIEIDRLSVAVDLLNNQSLDTYQGTSSLVYSPPGISPIGMSYPLKWVSKMNTQGAPIVTAREVGYEEEYGDSDLILKRISYMVMRYDPSSGIRMGELNLGMGKPSYEFVFLPTDVLESTENTQELAPYFRIVNSENMPTHENVSLVDDGSKIVYDYLKGDIKDPESHLKATYIRLFESNFGENRNYILFGANIMRDKTLVDRADRRTLENRD